MRPLMMNILFVVGAFLCIRDLTHVQTIDDVLHVVGMGVLVAAGVILGKILDSK